MSINEHVTNPSVIEENSREIKMNSNINSNDVSMNVINENIYVNNDTISNNSDNLFNDEVIPNVENNIKESSKYNTSSIKKDENLSNEKQNENKNSESIKEEIETTTFSNKENEVNTQVTNNEIQTKNAGKEIIDGKSKTVTTKENNSNNEDKRLENNIENEDNKILENNIKAENNEILENNINTEELPQSTKMKMKEPAEDSSDDKIDFNNNKLPKSNNKEQKVDEEKASDSKTKLHNVEENLYKLKVIEKRSEYEGAIQQKNIITQNINGPCPLLALCNILILRGDILIPLKKKEITYEEIIDILGDYIARHTGNLDNNNSISNDTNNNSNDNDNNSECNFQDVLDIIPTLKKGLDINVKFDSVLSFEPSPAFTVFKYFNIKLVHGWTVDPEDKETYKIIVKECGNYNKVVEKIIESDSANNSRNNLNASQDSLNTKNKKEELYHTGMVCKNFIESNASQLTYHGLTSIPEVLNVDEPTAFFRNNHFLTLIKTKDNNMYTLVTDQGFVNEKRIVWESLSTIDGDSIFVDGLFRKYNERSNNDLVRNSPSEDLDYAIALSLQEDEQNKRNEMLRRMNNEAIRKSKSKSNGRTQHNKNSDYNNTTNNNNNNNNTRRNSNKNTNINKSQSKESTDDKCLIM